MMVKPEIVLMVIFVYIELARKVNKAKHATSACLRRYAFMKKLLFMGLIWLCSCSIVQEDSRLSWYAEGGECSTPIKHLGVLRFIENEDQLKEILNEYEIEIQRAEEIFASLVAAKKGSGGKFAEISSTKRARKSLYGAWGFGVVKEECLVKFEAILVS